MVRAIVVDVWYELALGVDDYDMGSRGPNQIGSVAYGLPGGTR